MSGSYEKEINRSNFTFEILLQFCVTESSEHGGKSGKEKCGKTFCWVSPSCPNMEENKAKPKMPHKHTNFHRQATRGPGNQ